MNPSVLVKAQIRMAVGFFDSHSELSRPAVQAALIYLREILDLDEVARWEPILPQLELKLRLIRQEDQLFEAHPAEFVQQASLCLQHCIEALLHQRAEDTHRAIKLARALSKLASEQHS